VKRPISKANIRDDINDQVADFLNNGGAIDEVQQGLSGREGAEGPLKPDNSSFQQPKVERTYVPEVIAAIDERRNPKPVTPKPAKRRARMKVIYDDFGEPLRKIWTEE